MGRLRITCGLLILSLGVWAGEVDNYLSWRHNIEDSYSYFNQYLNSRIQKSLKYINTPQSDEGVSYNACEKVAYKIIYDLGTNKIGMAALNSEFETWVQKNKNIETYPINTTSNDTMRVITMYGPQPSFVEQFFLQVDRVVNVGGIYFGTDKISHFTGSGYLYFGNYLKAKKKGKSKLDAIKYAIKKGFIMEGGIIGIKSTGVFSYADQEANFQGMKMSIDMCEGENPYLERIDNKWRINREVDMRNYVNPNWDESYNVSGYIPSRVKKMSKMIKGNGYCDQLYDSWVLNQKDAYQLHILAKNEKAQSTEEEEIMFSPALIDELLLIDKDMQKLLKKNKIGPKSNYTLNSLCHKIYGELTILE